MDWIVLFLLAFCALVTAEVRISLDSAQLDGTWTLQNANMSIKTNGRVPGGVYSDLQDTGILKESLYYRQNDQVYKWIGHDDWTYSRQFDLSVDVLTKRMVNLVLHGADTVAQVWLNGVNIGNVSNMYTRYVYDIKDLAKQSGNSLEVRFFSPVIAANTSFHEQPHFYLGACSGPDAMGECYINMLRKMPCSFGWDWAPSYASSGLWKSVEIEATDSVIIRDVTTQAVKMVDGTSAEWELEITVFAGVAADFFSGSVRAELNLPQGRKIAGSTRDFHSYTESNEFTGELKLVIPEDQVSLWWPNGYGDQTLYDLDVILEPSDDVAVKKTIKVGFRTVEIVQDQITQDVEGNNFYFKVNGVRVFAKGVNWVPADLLPERSYNRNSIRHLLLSAKEANMNMMRIWGGGIYESDIFYEMADELGIMLWHDFMFSDAIYPADDAFMASVKTEVEQHVRRIQHHASIALWSGNNENESILMALYGGNTTDNRMYQADYRNLYIGTIKKTLDRLDPGRYYVASSPSNGEVEVAFGYLHPDSYSQLYGDGHYYNGQMDSWHSWNFPTYRFMSEFGYDGMNSFESIKKLSEPADWTITSEYSNFRSRRNGVAYNEMARLIGYHLPLPEDDSSLDFFQLFIYFSQVTQAMSIKTLTEKFRRERDVLYADNTGHTMGALYWMLNDVWPAPTWAGIEFGGRWKLLHYYAKNFFSPALVSFDVTEDGQLDVFLVSDLKTDWTGLDLYLMVHTFDSFDTKWMQKQENNTLTAGFSKSVWHTDNIDNLLSDANCAPNTCFIHAQLFDGETRVSDNHWFPFSFRDVKLTDSNLKVVVTNTSSTSVTLRLTADRIAPFVWLETSETGVFSENGFTMTKPESIVSFATRGEQLNQTAFAQSLTVRDLTSVKPKNPLAP